LDRMKTFSSLVFLRILLEENSHKEVEKLVNQPQRERAYDKMVNIYTSVKFTLLCNKLLHNKVNFTDEFQN